MLKWPNRYRGPSPIPSALLHGDQQTGVTICEVSPSRMDAGRILFQLPVVRTLCSCVLAPESVSQPIPRRSTFTSLSEKLASLGLFVPRLFSWPHASLAGAECLLKVLHNLPQARKWSYAQEASPFAHPDPHNAKIDDNPQWPTHWHSRKYKQAEVCEVWRAGLAHAHLAGSCNVGE